MEVTFLSSTGSFSGVDYNLSKVNKNGAELLLAENFDGLKHISSPSISDYTAYLKAWSDRNDRAKKTQFHVSISCRGNENSKEEILAVAREWMKEMGYEGVPALYIFHKDTDNNHLHIVSSRIDPQGHKVNDSNERWRGRAILKQLEGVTKDQEIKRDIEDILGYKVESRHQLKLLMELRNYKVIEDGDGWKILKYGKDVGSIDNNTIDKAIGQGLGADEKRYKRIKQLNAILNKYKGRGSISEIQTTMHRLFGVQLHFFREKGFPYGYVIIDHKEKTVYKGSQVMKLKDLLGEGRVGQKRNVDYTARIEEAHKLIAHYLEDKACTLTILNSQIKKRGFFIGGNNKIYLYGKEIDTLSKEEKYKIDYGNRVDRASKFKTTNEKLLVAIAQFYKVDIQDLKLSEVDTPMGRHPQNLLDEGLRSGDLFYHLSLNEAYLFRGEDGKSYLFDFQEKSVSEVTLNNPDMELVVAHNPAHENDSPVINYPELSPSAGQGSEVSDNAPKKKRR